MADSVPPVTAATMSPRLRKCSASKSEYTPAAHAAVLVTTGPLMPYCIETWQEAMLGIISGTIIGPTRSQPLVTRTWASSATARIPPPPVAMMAPISQALASLISRPASARACPAAAMENCEKRSMRLDALRSMKSPGSKFLTSAAMLTGNSSASKLAIFATPETPASKLRQ